MELPIVSMVAGTIYKNALPINEPAENVKRSRVISLV